MLSTLTASLRVFLPSASLRALLVAAAFAALVSATPGDAIAQPIAGLVAHWMFDEGSSNVVHDASPNQNDGTLLNGAAAWTTGHSGGGLFFDGVSHTEVRVPASTSLGQFTAATFAAWVNNAEPARDGPIIAKEGSSIRSYWFGCIGGQFGMLLSPDGTSWPTIEPSRRMGGVPANRWTHLAATWDGSTMRMYENGLLIGTYPYTQAVANTSAYTSIGVNSAAGTTQFHGVLDDVYVYNRALSAAEVSSLMGPSPCSDSFTDAFDPPSPLWSNLVGNWTASGIGYYAQNASNNPYTYSGMPFDMTDFEVSVQINSLSDGGVWLRSDGTNRNGILLVTGGNGYGQGQRQASAGAQLYFHRVVSGSSSPALAGTANVFTPRTNHTLRIVVSGAAYAVFVDGAIAPATVLVDSTFSHGKVGLYCDQPNTPAGGSGPPQSFTAFTITGIGPVVGALQPAATCPAGNAAFSVTAAGTGPLIYQWQLETSPDNWVNASNGGLPYNGGTIVASGVTTVHLDLSCNVLPGAPAVRFRCIVTNPCGSITTNPAALSFFHPCSIADICGIGGPTASPCGDGLLTGDDFNAFINAFGAGDTLADICGIGGPPSPPDGLVTGDDFNAFIAAFANGCL